MVLIETKVDPNDVAMMLKVDLSCDCKILMAPKDEVFTEKKTGSQI